MPAGIRIAAVRAGDFSVELQPPHEPVVAGMPSERAVVRVTDGDDAAGRGYAAHFLQRLLIRNSYSSSWMDPRASTYPGDPWALVSRQGESGTVRPRFRGGTGPGPTWCGARPERDEGAFRPRKRERFHVAGFAKSVTAR